MKDADGENIYYTHGPPGVVETARLPGLVCGQDRVMQGRYR